MQRRRPERKQTRPGLRRLRTPLADQGRGQNIPGGTRLGPPAGTGTTGGGGGDGVGGGQGVSSSWRVGVTEAADREGAGETLQARLVGEGCRGFPAAVVFLTV